MTKADSTIDFTAAKDQRDCPVCKASLQDSPYKLFFEGEIYWFCNFNCLKQFVEMPSRFRKAKPIISL